MNLLFINLVRYNPDQFSAKVRDIANNLGIDPDWLMMCMYIESGLNHQAQNRYSNATGLIQFMPSTAAVLGTSTASLLAMSNVEQMDYVYQYLRSYQWKMLSFVDVYFAIFFPAAMGKADDWVLQTSHLSAGLIAGQNGIYDLDGNNEITVGEVKQAILSKVPDSVQEEFQKKTSFQ